MRTECLLNSHELINIPLSILENLGFGDFSQNPKIQSN